MSFFRQVFKKYLFLVSPYINLNDIVDQKKGLYVFVFLFAIAGSNLMSYFRFKWEKLCQYFNICIKTYWVNVNIASQRLFFQKIINDFFHFLCFVISPYHLTFNFLKWVMFPIPVCNLISKINSFAANDSKNDFKYFFFWLMNTYFYYTICFIFWSGIYKSPCI